VVLNNDKVRNPQIIESLISTRRARFDKRKETNCQDNSSFDMSVIRKNASVAQWGQYDVVFCTIGTNL
jgi:hypothetical protein